MRYRRGGCAGIKKLRKILHNLWSDTVRFPGDGYVSKKYER